MVSICRMMCWKRYTTATRRDCFHGSKDWRSIPLAAPEVTTRNKLMSMPSNGLLNEERRRQILEVLHRDGRVLVKDLARHFDISQITIRKNLEFLDSQGVIE